MKALHHFEINTKGRDFVVGDIHGCFTLLQQELDKAGFDPYADRLFSVGDLVDRGPENEEFWDWLRQPWFHSVKGNHEQLIIDAVKDDHPNSNAAAIHAMNGGMWFYDLPTVEQQCYAAVMEDLPIAIEVETKQGLVGIVHAECPLGDWDIFRTQYKNNQGTWDSFDTHALWARTKISKMNTTPVKGVYKLYVGHTPVDEVTTLGNVIYIDTGACFKGGKLTVLQIN